MSSPPPPLFQQIKEVLLELSMAFDNFIEVNNTLDLKNNKTETSSKSPTAEYPTHKFQRRRPDSTLSTTTTTSSSSSNGSSTSGRKRSWDSEEQQQNPETIPFDPPNFTGKRSKSLVLTQELEGLRLSSSSPNKLDLEMNEWLDQDLNHKYSILGNIERFDDLKREIEVIGSNGTIDDILKVLCAFKSGTETVNRSDSLVIVSMTHWIKWGIINEVTESIKSPDLQAKTILNRSLLLLTALTRTNLLVDWTDPELSFLLNKFLIILLNSNKFKNPNVFLTHRLTLTLNRKLEEFLGLLRVLNLFSRLPVPQNSFNFLLSRSDTFSQIIELLQLLFETNLNIFELTATISSLNKDFTNFNAAAISVLLSLKIIENYGNSSKEIKEIITAMKSKIA